MNPVADAYYRGNLETRPLSAFFSGVPYASLDPLDENRLEARERTRQWEDEWLARLRAVSSASLAGTPAQVTHAVLSTVLETAVARRVCRDEM